MVVSFMMAGMWVALVGEGVSELEGRTGRQGKLYVAHTVSSPYSQTLYISAGWCVGQSSPKQLPAEDVGHACPKIVDPSLSKLRHTMIVPGHGASP